MQICLYVFSNVCFPPSVFFPLAIYLLEKWVLQCLLVWSLLIMSLLCRFLWSSVLCIPCKLSFEFRSLIRFRFNLLNGFIGGQGLMEVHIVSFHPINSLEVTKLWFSNMISFTIFNILYTKKVCVKSPFLMSVSLKPLFHIFCLGFLVVSGGRLNLVHLYYAILDRMRSHFTINRAS